MAKIIGIDPESVSDGPGVRFTIFFSGCRHQCPGCHNPDAQDFNAGVEFDELMQTKVIDHIVRCPSELLCELPSTVIHTSALRTLTSGVTLSGGDPMFSAGDVLRFVRQLRATLPDISIWLYTGFTYEEISDVEQKALMAQCDVMVDGRFEQEHRDLSASFRGSTNQRIIDLATTREAGQLTLWKE